MTVRAVHILAASCCALAIAAGAFGAHAAQGQAVEWLHTGGEYQLVHGVAAIALVDKAFGPAMLLLLGSFVFAVTLYAMALGAPRWFGAITPVGGILMIAGWLWFAYRASASRNA